MTPYMVELLLAEDVALDENGLRAALVREWGEVREVPGADRARAYQRPGWTSKLEDDDGRQIDVPATWAVCPSTEPPDHNQIAAALEQNRLWSAAAGVVAGCRGAWALSDMYAHDLARAQRLGSFQAAVRALLSVAPVKAILWMTSQRLVDPVAYRAASTPEAPLSAGAVNVRMYSVEGPAGETIMDSLGLAVFDLPDVQFRFAGGIEPSDVASKLFATARYLFDNGPLIGDGETIDGIPEGTRWRASEADAALAPTRRVIDFRPA